MFNFFSFYLPLLAIVLLFIATGVLVFFNHNEKVINLALTGLFVGTATTFVTIVVGLSEKLIQDSFITSIVTNEKYLPIYISEKENPSIEKNNNLTFLSNHREKDKDGNWIQAIKSPENDTEAFIYLGELLQYALFKEIHATQMLVEEVSTKFSGTGVLVEPNIHLQIQPPKPKTLEKDYLSKVLSENRFAKISKDEHWAKLPFNLPENTQIELFFNPTQNEHKILITKRNYFKIEFRIRPTITPPQGAIPPAFDQSMETVGKVRTFFFVIDMKATLLAMTAQNSHRQRYEDWIRSIFNEIKTEFDN